MRLLLAIFISTLAVSAEIIPAARRITWAPGVPGGIPARSTIYTTLSSSATTAQINTALTDAGSGEVVLLEAGTFNITGTITIPSNKTLRGSGKTATILSWGAAAGGGIQYGSGTNPAEGTSTSISSGATKDSTSIVVASATGISVGTLLAIVHTGESFVTDAGDSSTCDWCDDGWAGVKNMGQTVRVTAVDGTTLTIDPPLYHDYINSPTAHRFSASATLGGVEDLTVYANDTGVTYNFFFSGADRCWIKNVKSDFTDGDHARALHSVQCSIVDSDFYDSFEHFQGTQDGTILLGTRTSAFLIQNNVFWRMHASIMLNWGAAGNVIAYNYSTNTYHSSDGIYIAWQINDFVFHGAHPSYNLFEGNVLTQFRPDSTWGSSSHTTFFRNRVSSANTYHTPFNARGTIGSGTYQTDNTYAITIDFRSQYNNIVGNNVGSAWFRDTQPGTVYLTTAAPNEYSEFRFGFKTSDDSFQNSDAFSTVIMHGNYSWINDAIQWDAGISDHDLPNSYYLSEKPSWFGNLAWPPIGPDDGTSTTGTDIPAGYRFINGSEPPQDAAAVTLGSGITIGSGITLE